MRDFDYGDTTEFLHSFYSGVEHNVELRALSNDGSGRPGVLFISDFELAQDFCRRWDGPGYGTYMAVATRRKDASNGKRESLAELPGVWVEIDGYKHGISTEQCVAALNAAPLKPTCIVFSGRGVHAYWLFREPMDVRLPVDGPDTAKDDVEAVLRQLCGVFAGDPNAIDITRIMRLPGTHNTKDGGMVPVAVLEASGARHEIADIADMLDYLAPLLRAPVATESRVATAGTTPAVPDNPFSEFAKRFVFKAAIDARQRLAAMAYEAEGEASVHQTQLQVSASLVRSGAEDEEIVALILDATHRAAGVYGEKWNWKREEANLQKMIATARAKYPAQPRIVPVETPPPVAQLRAGGAQPIDAQELAVGDVAAEPAPELMGYPLNDLGNAMRLIVAHGGALRYVVGIGWHVWDERRYKVDPGLIDARKLAHETARTMLTQAFDVRALTEKRAKARDQIIKFAITCGNTNRITGMLSQAEPHLAAEADDLDKDPMLLNCLNGTVEQKTSNLRQHQQEDLLTKICGTTYDPDALCPIWEKFVLDIFDDDVELVSFVQRAFGYSLTGLTTEQVVFILHGSGSNGKSVLIETIAAVMGNYAQQCPSETFISQEKGSRIPSDLARLAGARFVSVVETEHERSLAEGLVKQATGGDRMAARFLHKEWFEFTPNFKLWLATNHKPRIRGSDFAIWRRILLLPFSVTFVDADKLSEGQKVKDPDLKNKLIGEYPGILAWVVRGCIAWQQGGLRPPAAVVHATEGYQDSQDNVSGFIRDTCHISRGLECPTKLLHAGYEIWCEENDETPIRLGAFGKNLDERGYQAGPRTNRARPRKGIDLKEEFKISAAQRAARPTTDE